MPAPTLEIFITARDQASAALKGVGDAAVKAGKGFGVDAKAIGLGLGAAGLAVTAFAGASLKHMGDVGAEMLEASQKTGVSTEALSGLRFAAEQGGSSLEGVTGGLLKMSKFMGEAAGQGTATTEALAKLGLNLFELQQMSPDQQFLAFGDAMNKTTDQAQKVTLAMDVFGKSGTDLLPFFAQGKDGIAALQAEAESLGIVLSADAAAGLEGMGDAMNTAGKAMEGIQTTIATALAPALTALATKVGDVIAAVQGWMKENPGLADILIKIGTGLGLFLAALLPIIAIGGPLIGVIAAVGAALTFLSANPIVLIIAAIAALGVAIALIITHWEDFKAKVVEIVTGIVTWLGEHWPEVATILTSVFLGPAGIIVAFGTDAFGLRTKFIEVFEGIKTWFAGLWNGISTFFTGLWTTISTTVGDTVSAFGTKVRGVFDPIKIWFEDLWNGVSTFFTTLWTTISTTVGDTISGFGTAIRGVFNPIKTWFENLWNGISTWFTTTWTNLSNGVQGIVKGFRDAIVGFFTEIATKIGEFFKMLGEIPSRVKEAVKDVPVLGGIAGAVGGLFGFQHGGAFTVGGSGGADSSLVAFRATPGERVVVAPPGGFGGGGGFPTVINLVLDGQLLARVTREQLLRLKAREVTVGLS